MVRLLNDFSRVCKKIGEEELCSCDYRINIYGCPSSDFYVMTTKSLIPICVLVTIMSGAFLIYLITIKKQPFFLNATKERGWLRPRPLHSYHLIVFSFMFFEAFHLIFLLNEWYPNFKAAEVGNMLANSLSGAVSILYPVSIVYSTPNIHLDRSSFRNVSIVLNKRFVDIVGIILFLEPLVTLLPLATITGHYAGMDDIKTANTFFTALYFAWIFWEFVFLTILAYFWYKLMSVIKHHIKMLKERNDSGIASSNQIKDIKKSTRTVTIPVMAIVFGLLFQAIIYIVMSTTYRTTTIYHYGWNLFYYWIEYVAFPVLGFGVEAFLLYSTIANYRKKRSQNALGKLSSSSSSQAQLNSSMEKKTNTDIANPTVIHYTSETTETVEIITLVENDNENATPLN